MRPCITLYNYRYYVYFFDKISGLLCGAVAFILIYGLSIVDPLNIGWLSGGDSPTYYLGGAFFQISPWGFPLGLNPYYGAEIPNAIGLSDSIPLFGMLAKTQYLFSKIVIQYVGIWVLFSFLMQGFFSYYLASQYTRYYLAKVSFSVIALFLPCYLTRMLNYQHFPLAAQFFILAAFCVIFSKKLEQKTLLWLLTISFCSLCNAYITAMLLALWLGELLYRFFINKVSLQKIILEITLVLACLIATLWISGFFVMSSGYGAEGFGVFRANLLSIFDSEPIPQVYWSHLIPGTPKVSLQHNAPNYMGTGLLLLLIVTIFCVINEKLWHNLDKRICFIGVSVFLMLLFSLSNRISIGSYEFIIPIPNSIEKIASLLRDSGRFMWPTVYFILFICLYFMSKVSSKPLFITIFILSGLLQIFDSHMVWGITKPIVEGQFSSSWKTSLVSPFWNKAGGIYNKVLYLPVENKKLQYEDIAYFALKNKLFTDAVYLSRFDQQRADRENMKFESELASGKFDMNALYILDNKYYSILSNIIKKEDLFERIDGFFVLAPNWFVKTHCGQIHDRLADKGCVPRNIIDNDFSLDNLSWSPWGNGKFNISDVEVESNINVDAGYVTRPITMGIGSYRVKACLTWNVIGENNAVAHVAIYGVKKLIEIPTSQGENQCMYGWFDVDHERDIRFSFGLGGWSTGRGKIRLQSISIAKLITESPK